MLGRKIFGNTVFAVVDQLISKTSATLAFIALVRLLPQSDIAAIGVATSYLVLIAYFDVGFIRILLRDYTKILQIADARDLHFSAYMMFLLTQMGVIVGVAAHECTCNSKCGVCCRRCLAAKRERLDLKTVEGISLNTLRAASFDFSVFMRAVVVDDELEASRRRVSS